MEDRSIQVETPEYESDHTTAFISGQEVFSLRNREKENLLIAQRIKQVRVGLGLNQIPFAQRLGFDQTTISKWEKGRARPTPDALIQIASVATGIDKLFFLEHAGLPPEYFDGHRMIPEIQEASERVVARAMGKKEAPPPIWVPLFKDAVAAGEARTIDDRSIDEWIPVSKRFAPVAAELRALKVSGDSMSPIIDDGYVVLVDVSQKDPRRLIGRMVAAREGDGVTIKWLRKDKDAYLLVPQHVSERIPVRVMRPEDDWGVVGTVVNWIGYPPPPRKRG